MNPSLTLIDKPKIRKKEVSAEQTAQAYLSHLSLDDAAVLKNVKTLKMQMDCVYDQLNFVTDETLIDSYIYEIKAIHMKYKYYINVCKQRGLSVGYF